MAIDTSNIFAELAKLDASYLQRRRLLEGPDETAQGLIEDIKQCHLDSVPAEMLASLLFEVVSQKGTMPLVVLNLFSWLALEAENWADADDLAREVINRDHHDLLAQRLVDAAEAKSVSLDLEIDDWLQTRTCKAPFSEIETRTNGQVHFCCSAWQPAPIGPLDAKGGEGFLEFGQCA